MKRLALAYIMGILFLFITMAVTAAIAATVVYTKWMDETTLGIIMNIVSAILFFTASAFIGYIIQAHGLLHGGIIAIFYLGITALILKYTPEMSFLNQLNMYIRSAMLIIGAIFGVNLRK